VMVSDLFMKAEYFISCFMLQVSLWGREELTRLLLWGRTIKVMDLLDASSDELFLVHSLECLCASGLSDCSGVVTKINYPLNLNKKLGACAGKGKNHAKLKTGSIKFYGIFIHGY
jgi:hypothetical protein